MLPDVGEGDVASLNVDLSLPSAGSSLSITVTLQAIDDDASKRIRR